MGLETSPPVSTKAPSPAFLAQLSNRYAAIFEEMGWTWGIGASEHVPNAAEIEKVLRSRINNDPPGTITESGRIVSFVMDDGSVAYLLVADGEEYEVEGVEA